MLSILQKKIIPTILREIPILRIEEKISNDIVSENFCTMDCMQRENQ